MRSGQNSWKTEKSKRKRQHDNVPKHSKKGPPLSFQTYPSVGHYYALFFLEIQTNQLGGTPDHTMDPTTGPLNLSTTSIIKPYQQKEPFTTIALGQTSKQEDIKQKKIKHHHEIEKYHHP